MASDSQRYWESVYETKECTDVSWFQAVPERSLELVQRTGLPSNAALLDVGGGASTLVDHLLAVGFTDITVLDLAPAALEASKARLMEAAAGVEWVAADVSTWRLPRRYDLWHDRAVLHFLVDHELRDRYLGVLRHALAPGGYVILSTFGPQGPERCSGLNVQRYSTEELTALLGDGFQQIASCTEDHITPSGRIQQFVYGLWRAEA